MTGQAHRGQNSVAYGKKSHGIPAPAAEVGSSFVKQYYTMLAKDPLKLYKFYKAQSVYSRGVEGAPDGDGSYVSACGRREIHSEILDGRSLGDVTKVDIQCVESQESRHGGVLVLVTGYLTYDSTAARQHFAQTFFLDQQDEPYEGYFILNDVCRFLPGPEVSTNTPTSSRANSALQDEGLQPQAPSQPPPQQSPVPRHSPQQFNISTPMATARSGTPRVASPAQELPPIASEESAVSSPLEQEAMPTAFNEEDDEAPSPVKANHDVSSAALETVMVEPEEEELEEQPKTWASLAKTLGQGGGKLAPSKAQGHTAPTVPKAVKPVLPPPGTKALQASGSVGALPSVQACSSSQPSSSSGAAPPPTVAPGSSGASQGEGHTAVEVKLWLSRIPADLQSTDNQEVLDCLTGLLEGPSHGRVLDIVRKDNSKDWAHVTVSSQEVADAIVQASKDRKILLRGKSLKAEYDRPRSGARGGGRGRGSGEGSGRATDHAEGKDDAHKAGDKHDNSRSHRRGGKGGGR